MGKFVALTARKLKPGSYDAWREAWGSVDGPSGATAYICRNLNDPDEIVAFGMIEATQEELMAMRPSGDGRRLAWPRWRRTSSRRGPTASTRSSTRSRSRAQDGRSGRQVRSVQWPLWLPPPSA